MDEKIKSKTPKENFNFQYQKFLSQFKLKMKITEIPPDKSEFSRCGGSYDCLRQTMIGYAKR